MTQYKSLNVNLSNSQPNKSKSTTKNETELIFKTVIKHDKTNFPHKLLLTNRQISNLRKSFANN